MRNDSFCIGTSSRLCGRPVLGKRRGAEGTARLFYHRLFSRFSQEGSGSFSIAVVKILTPFRAHCRAQQVRRPIAAGRCPSSSQVLLSCSFGKSAGKQLHSQHSCDTIQIIMAQCDIESFFTLFPRRYSFLSLCNQSRFPLFSERNGQFGGLHSGFSPDFSRDPCFFF